MACPECGYPYDANQSSCPECGCPNESIASSTDVKDDSMVCPYCGAPIEGLKVCQWCGKPLEEDTEDTEDIKDIADTEDIIEDIEHESISPEASNTADEGIEYEQNDSVLSETQNIASPSIDLNKKKPLNPWYIAIPVSVLLTTVFCVILVRSKEDYKKETDVEFNTDVEVVSSRMSGQRVYSCAYDGFTNIREDPSFSAKVIGQFRNGPEGAILLEDLGEWMKIEISGQIGYVVSKYVRDAPSVAYTGDITVDWIEGIWSSGDGFPLLIFNNGTWETGYNGTDVYGTYLLQNKNELVLTPVWELDAVDFSWVLAKDEDIRVVKINKVEKLLEYSGADYHKEEYVSQKDEEYYEYGCLTKSEFKSKGKELLQLIENR